MVIARRTVTSNEATVTAGLERIRTELKVPTAFPADVLAEAERLPTLDATTRDDRRDLDLVTIDPAGAADLDQALCIEATEAGHVVWYAIADVAALVTPGGAIDRESHARGVTLYAPDQRSPLHPPALSESAGSLLADQDRPAVLWRLELDSTGELIDTTVVRAMVRSREQLSYPEAQARIDAGDERLSPLRTVGRQREALEQQRGGVSLPVPEQEVEHREGGYQLRYRASLPVEGWNAQISLLCGMAAAKVMIASGWGLLRTLPTATDDALAVLHRHAQALSIDWPSSMSYGEVIRRLDPTVDRHAAFFVQATRLFRGAGYQALIPGAPGQVEPLIHGAIAAPYAHVTAPLRRLGDRYATETVLAAVAGSPPPAWVVDTLGELPSLIQSGTSRASALDRAVVDFMEALLLSGAVGTVYDAVVVDHRHENSVVQFTDLAVVGTVPSQLDLGAECRVRVVAADPHERTVTLELVS